MGVRLLVLILLISCVSCSYKSASINTGYGQPTGFGSVNHIKGKENYSIKTLTVGGIKDYTEWEINISEHMYFNNKEDFSCISIGSKLWLIKDFSWLSTGIGAGFRITEKDDRNIWFADSYLLGDISAKIGIKKSFKNFDFQIFYSYQHLSVPWRNDRGINYDIIEGGITIPFSLEEIINDLCNNINIFNSSFYSYVFSSVQ